MYRNILKKDLKNGKTMNIILLLFIILASTFIASSINNVLAVTTALDNYLNEAGVPDFWLCTSTENETSKIEAFLKEKNADFQTQELKMIDATELSHNNQKIDDVTTSIVTTDLKHTTEIYHMDNTKVDTVHDGEIYTSVSFASSYNIEVGDELEFKYDDKVHTFTFRGTIKDPLFSSPMIGISRLLISTNDYNSLTNSSENSPISINSISVYTNMGDSFMKTLNNEEFNLILSVDRSTIETMYIMDMIIAIIMLIVSVCLIVISFVILRFTIHFTMSGEFREIGVMKALGIKNRKIRALYLIKYVSMAFVGGIVGFFLSIPFSQLMLDQVDKNIVIQNKSNLSINAFCVIAVIGIVLIFSYLCTRTVKKLSPLDAMRNGANGQRYHRKSFLRLGSVRLRPIPFLACNDILSNIRRFVILIVIFTLGILLITIPINSINTLQSDHLLTSFSMAPSDLVISNTSFLTTDMLTRESHEENLDEVQQKLTDEGIAADVFQEITFRLTISCKNEKTSSLAIQGLGDVSTNDYEYLEGTPPQNRNEVAISHIVSKRINANIGDTVSINLGNQVKAYTVTALYQTMNNMGEGIRFHPDEALDFSYIGGLFGIQIRYVDNLSEDQKKEHRETITRTFPDYTIFSCGEYIGDMIGGVAQQIQPVKKLIILIVLCINILVTILMVKSFITKEKGEIGMLKAIGFSNFSLMLWQTLRIGIVLFLAIVIGTLISTPLSGLTAGKVFQIMGCESVQFDVVPMEVYVIYPLIILTATVLTAFITSMQLKKITAAETATIE